MNDKRTPVTARDLDEWFGAAEVGRLPAGLLPGALVHGPSRRFLTGVGLPFRAAGLELDAGAVDPWPTLSEALGEEIPGGGRLLVIGAPVYGDGLLVLDGVGGTVHLAARCPGPPAEPALDLIATDLSTLVSLLREAAAVRRAAADPPDAAGRRGPGTVRAVVAEVERRMRELDRAPFDAEGSAPYWSTFVRAEALRWGASRGDGTGLAYDLTPELVAELGEPVRHAAAELPAGLTHGPTGRLLAEAGLPLGHRLLQDPPRQLVPLVEADPWRFDEDWDEEEDDRPHQRDFLRIGGWPYDCEIVLDGRTGRVEVTTGDGEEGWPEAYLNQDLSALLYMCWTVDRIRAEHGRGPAGPRGGGWRVFDPSALLEGLLEELLTEIDPAAFESEQRPWRGLAEDHHMGGLLG
ncbi:SUKH-4 family immunity protein [Kitasatospora sp. NBC_00240]|uniref:SUKH-4 family immunity protein n=1 Tax=Kitasatospora sp. NBC_00240 TaxID=2903567 RepID=UPI002256D0A7|nr:SUKH-4 family immunity protein [Kitasatospora sp. NBC_00240]MCX5211820.1 SUKH-4 family immunity protein [Kitasatospora sp. NBC_00240]